MLYIAIGNIAIYLIDLFSLGGLPLVSMLSFNRYAIFHGQIWRLVSFVFISESGDLFMRGSGVFFVLISAYFYWWIGSLLEREWGTTKFTVFYLGGVVLNILYGLFTGYASMAYVNLSMFFAFATLYPEMEILLFMILPVKVKWIGWIDAALFAWGVLSNLLIGNWIGALLPMVAVLNYFIFFWPDFRYLFAKTKRRTSAQTINFKKAQKELRERRGYLHKCSVCGVTDQDDPNMEFRYCSKCSGYYCYCANHINNHTHVL
ncbi:MAG: rhomboid family intramembrane serine protease [Lawsonibacter sp.]|nr:rhomboid family intramembrane serine protease [Lawsonibacter sp.]